MPAPLCADGKNHQATFQPLLGHLWGIIKNHSGPNVLGPLQFSPQAQPSCRCSGFSTAKIQVLGQKVLGIFLDLCFSFFAFHIAYYVDLFGGHSCLNLRPWCGFLAPCPWPPGCCASPLDSEGLNQPKFENRCLLGMYYSKLTQISMDLTWEIMILPMTSVIQGIQKDKVNISSTKNHPMGIMVTCWNFIISYNVGPCSYVNVGLFSPIL